MRAHYNEFACPQCHGALSKYDNSLKCNQCLKDFPIISNIPCFASGSSAWKFSSSESTAQIIEAAKKRGWKVSLSRMNKDKADWIRGAGRFTISVLASPKERVLDLGCGWGGLSFWMAKEFRHIYALDVQLDGLQFIDIRASQEGISNITTAQGSVFSLPFPNRFFDVVVLNGVLEWVGTFSEEHPPKVLQEMALNEVARVVQPEGTLFVAIENRFGLQYVLGYKEEHTGLRYISLLPRSLAQVYHRYRKGTDFRVLTHSRSGLMKMLGRCGFSRTEWFSVFPSYRNCRYAASLEGYGALKFLLRNFATQKTFLPDILLQIGIWVLSKSSFLLKIGNFFSPSWIVFASQKKTPQLGLKGKEDFIAIKDSKHANLALVITNRRASIFRIESPSGRPQGKYTIPINEWAAKKIVMSQSCVKLIGKLRPSLNDNLPRISIYFTKSGLFEYTKAVSGAPLNPRDPKDLNLFFDFVVALSQFSVPENEIQATPEEFDIRDTLSASAKKQGLTKNMQNLLQKAQIIHGDFNNRNILVSRVEPRRAVIIDFEHAKIGPAVFNWYDFLLRNFVIYGGRYPIKASVVLERCHKLAGNQKAYPALNKLTAKFLNACQVPVTLHGQLTLLYLGYLCQDPIVTDPEAVFRALLSMDFEI